MFYLPQIKYGLACQYAAHLLACCGSWLVTAPLSHRLRRLFLSMLCYTYKGPANISLDDSGWLPSHAGPNPGPDFGLWICNFSPRQMVWWKYYQNRHRCLPLPETYFGKCRVSAEEIAALRLFASNPSAYFFLLYFLCKATSAWLTHQAPMNERVSLLCSAAILACLKVCHRRQSSSLEKLVCPCLGLLGSF